MNHYRLIFVVALAGCAPSDGPPDANDWYDQGSGYDVAEPVEFTRTAYDFPSNAADGIGPLSDAIFPVDNYVIAFGPDDQFPSDSSCESVVDTNLPSEVEGVVTIHPRFYLKTSGCVDDEKYYGSFFIQDKTGGFFVLGDSKVAHFDIGDKVRMKVRGARSAFDLNMIYAHDILEVERTDGAVYFEEPTGPLGPDHVAKVQRVSGVVTTDPDTFGEFLVEADDGTRYAVSLDSELNRRGVAYSIGTRIQATGPVLYSYSTYSVIIMNIGQVTVLD